MHWETCRWSSSTRPSSCRGKVLTKAPQFHSPPESVGMMNMMNVILPFLLVACSLPSLSSAGTTSIPTACTSASFVSPFIRVLQTGSCLCQEFLPSASRLSLLVLLSRLFVAHSMQSGMACRYIGNLVTFNLLCLTHKPVVLDTQTCCAWHRLFCCIVGISHTVRLNTYRCVSISWTPISRILDKSEE